jgi:hypothetical protein
MHGDAYDTARASLVNDIAEARTMVIELKKQSAAKPADPARDEPTPKEDATPPKQLSLFEE